MTLPRISLAAGLALVLLLPGCSLVPAPAVDTTPAATAAPEVETPVDGPQPSAGAIGADAAEQMVQLRWEALAAGDWDAACSLYSTVFVERLLAVSSSEDTDCVAALEAEADGVDDVLATAADGGYAPRVPYYYVPSGISITTSAFEVDSDDLIYVPGTAVTSTDPFVFEEGTSATPGWLTESSYIQRGQDGRWRFITSAERAE